MLTTFGVPCDDWYLEFMLINADFAKLWRLEFMLINVKKLWRLEFMLINADFAKSLLLLDHL